MVPKLLKKVHPFLSLKLELRRTLHPISSPTKSEKKKKSEF